MPELRPGLRRWYQLDAEKDPAATALRDHLSQLAGEKLEHITDNPHNPRSCGSHFHCARGFHFGGWFADAGLLHAAASG